MAPIATSTVSSPPDSSTVGVGKTFGNYKEQAPGAQDYNKKLEEEGDADHPKANVFHVRPNDITGLTAPLVHKLSSHMESR